MQDSWSSDDSDSWDSSYTEHSSRFSTDATRDALMFELAEKEWNDAPVLEHYLKVDAIPSGFVDRCRKHLRDDAAVQAKLVELRRLFKQPTMTIQESKKQERRETKMYSPLLCILNAIAEFSEGSRRFRDSHKKAAAFEDGFPAFSPLQPDLILQEKHTLQINNALLWRDVLCCVEVKFPANEGPLRTKNVSANTKPTVKRSTAQSADYARIHMSCRPFQLFSIGIMIYNSYFVVSVYDRGGVMHSPQMEVFNAGGVTKDFIRVVRRLSRDLTEQELGRDPTVAVANSADGSLFPTYSVGLSTGSSSRRTDNTSQHEGPWMTEGRPIWTAYSLFGRGTTVWRVKEDSVQCSQVILKTAWRHNKHETESKIYEFLKEKSIIGKPGIAVFVGGKDVTLEDPSGDIKLSVNSLRPPRAEFQLHEDIVLHRVVLGSVGKPLWEYSTPAEFIRALIAVVNGIAVLEQHGILHRDISAGNVLLAVDSRPGYEAFLSDFEFAKVPPQPRWIRHDIVNKVEIVSVPGDARSRQVPAGSTNIRTTWTEASPEYIPGPEMTGTVQFMAIDILNNYIGSKLSPPAPFMPHATRHDLESLIWVVIYCLYRKIYQSCTHLARDDPTRCTIAAAFTAEFGNATAEGILKCRNSMKNEHMDSSLLKVLPFMEPVLQRLAVELVILVRYQNDAPRAGPTILENVFLVERSQAIQSRRMLKRIDITCTEIMKILEQLLAQCVST